MDRTFLAPFQYFQKQFIRNIMKRKKTVPKNVYKRVGNDKKFGCLTYYPKDNFEVPENVPEPPKLFRVQRFAPLRHRIFWERKILFDFGLINKIRDVAIVKNTPENNALLWKIKHLVTVEPISFPYGEPTEEDIAHTKLKEDGKCIVHKKIGVDDKRLEVTEKVLNDPIRLDRKTLEREAMLKWVRHY